MSEVVKPMSSLDQLSAKLLSTLDETVFFTDLSSHLIELIGADSVKVYKVQEDSSSKLVSKDLKPVIDGEELIIGEGPAGHVIRTKRPYFSNNVSRDPIFVKEAKEGIKTELCLPVSHEGILLATVHLQRQNEEGHFSREDITKGMDLFKSLSTPLANLKLYLSARSLNEVLLRKIEEKEKELEERKSGLVVSESFKVEEKDIIGKSDALKRVLNEADRLAASEVNGLIYGEAGSGKEILARRIHCRSKRGDKSFVVFDCLSLDTSLLLDELFGKSEALGTGAPLKKSLLESANGGTLYLENVHALPIGAQSALIQFIKEGIAFKKGEQIPYRVDVRILASSSISIEERVQEGRFREDLFYALSTMIINVPSLKERGEDIELLAEYFLNEGKSSQDQKSLSPCVIKALRDYHWPGNVRELQNIMERAYILADGMIIDKTYLADCVLNSEAHQEVEEEEEISYKEMTLDELEKIHICRTLEHLGGNKTKTAKTLGITVKTLYNKLHSYGMIAQKDA